MSLLADVASLSDVRHTIRQLRQAPGFTIATVLTFAVAIGSNSAVFSARAVASVPILASSARE
jgi:hypothetical protein